MSAAHPGLGSLAGLGGSGRLPDAFRVPGSSSFSEFVGQVAPELLPGAT